VSEVLPGVRLVESEVKRVRTCERGCDLYGSGRVTAVFPIHLRYMDLQWRTVISGVFGLAEAKGLTAMLIYSRNESFSATTAIEVPIATVSTREPSPLDRTELTPADR
jgi:hypothetical protein